MPRQKSVVMEVQDKAALREHALRRAVDLHEPYRLFSSKARGAPKSTGNMLVYVDPVSGDREVVMENLDRQTGKDLQALLERAWSLGRSSSIRD